MRYRCEIPGALYRRAAQRAEAQGSDLQAIVRALLTLYAEGQLDPLAADPIASASAARGGHARAATLTTDQRRSSAQHAARIRWTRHDPVS